MEGDAEANYAYYALHEFQKFPNELFALSREERAFIYAAIDVRIAAEKKAQAQAKRGR